jgi:hypothetical protein
MSANRFTRFPDAIIIHRGVSRLFATGQRASAVA